MRRELDASGDGATMYLTFYGLAEKPFSQTPDPKFLYWNEAYRETIASLRYGIEERKGFVTMIGEAGTGKTTLLRKLLDDLGPDAVSVFLFNPNATFEEILEYTLSELGIPAASGRKLAMLQRLNDFLLAAFNEGKNTILLIDEAQDLETEVLESLRLLSNLETTKEKILQIVLSGQPELAARLAQPNLRQLKQRIAVRCRIEPLGRDELEQYVAARLAVAGGRPDLFQPETFDAIWAFSRGIPRLINTVCDNALLVGYALGRQTIDAGVITEVVSDLERIDLPFATAEAPAQAEAAPAAAPEVVHAPAPPTVPQPAVAAGPIVPDPAQAPPPAAAPLAASPTEQTVAGPATARPRMPSRAPFAAEPPRRRTGTWAGAAVVIVLGLAVAALAAGGWREVEPRVRRWLGEDGGDATRERAESRGRAADLGLAPDDERAALPPDRSRAAVPPDPPSAAREVQPGSADRAEAGTEPAAAASTAEVDALPSDMAPAPDRDETAEIAAGVSAPVAIDPAPPARDDAADQPGSAVPVALQPDASEQRLAALPPPSPPVASDPDSSQDLQAGKRAVVPSGKRVLVRRGDTLLNLAAREYGRANYTTLDVLRVVNPDIKDVNKIIAGEEIVFPDPGPSARLLDDPAGLVVLVATTPILVQAREIQRSIGSRFRLPAELEPIPVGGGQNLYRVSLRQLPDRAQALQVAESLGSILKDPS